MVGLRRGFCRADTARTSLGGHQGDSCKATGRREAAAARAGTLFPRSGDRGVSEVRRSGSRRTAAAIRQFTGDDSAHGGRWSRHHGAAARSEEHTSELQSLMRISYAVFCLKKKKRKKKKAYQK